MASVDLAICAQDSRFAFIPIGGLDAVDRAD